MADEDKYKTQIEDFRNLKPYYDLVFDIMTQLARYSFERDLLQMTRALRELIINASPYILDADSRLEELDKELAKVLTEDYFKPSLSREQSNKIELLKDNYFKYVQKLRVVIAQELEKSGFMPKMDKVRQKQQSDKTKGASI